jgi:hypothetical protein
MTDLYVALRNILIKHEKVLPMLIPQEKLIELQTRYLGRSTPPFESVLVRDVRYMRNIGAEL